MGERGTALLLAVMLVLVVSAIAAAVWVTSRAETLMAATFRQEREAFYAAEGGIALAIRDLSAIGDWTTALTGATTSSFTDGASIGMRRLPSGDVIVLCCGPGSLSDQAQRSAQAGRSWADDTPRWQIFAWGPVASWLPAGRISSPLYVVVWVSDDPADGDGDPSIDSNGVLELHAQAIGPSGLRRAVQVLVRRQAIAEDAAPGPGVRVLSWREVR